MSAARLGLCLLQPEAHVHIAVQRYCGGEVLADLLLLLCTLIELAKAEVAVGDERAHPKPLGERERLTVVARSVVWVIVAGGDLAEEAKSPRLVAASTVLAGKAQGSPDAFESVVEPVGEDVRFAQIHDEAREVNSESHRLNGTQRALQQRNAFGDSSREGVDVAQTPSVLH